MGILDNIIGKSPFLRDTQSMFNPQAQQPVQPQQPVMPAMPQPGTFAPPTQQQGQGGQGGQQGGLDIGMIMKIMSMFGGA